MPRNKSLKPSSGDEGEWIMSYADTVTLLLCFFVIFFSQSKITIEEEKKEEPMQAVIEVEKEVKNANLRKRKTLEELKKLLTAEFDKQSLQGIEVKQEEDEVIVRLNEKEFFKVGSFRLINTGEKSLQKIAASLSKIATNFEIHVEGHTDSKPVRGSTHYRSNLGLSSLRASTAAEVLVSYGLDKSRVRIVGYGDSRPVAQDRILASETQEVQYLDEQSKLNRRVEVKLVYLEKEL